MSAVGSRTDSTRTSPLGRSRPRPDIGRIKIPQRSSLLCAIPFVRKHRRYWAVKRREFITLLGGAAAWPLAAHAQQVPKLPTIGFLGAATASFERASTDSFVQRLRELGWIENRTVAIEYRWAEGRDERFAQIAAEFVRLKVDVILTYGTPSILAAKKATAVIPIVFAAAGDPVRTNLVASLARSGGKVIGISLRKTDFDGKS